MDLLTDQLMPKTDTVVVVQAVVVLVLVAVGVWRTWRMPDIRLFVLGVGVFVLGLMALRAAH